MKSKNATMNHVSDDDKCLQYAATLIVNYEEIGKLPQRLSKIKPFINKYNWKGINYPSGKNEWKDKKIQQLFLICYTLKN